jgi:pseudaminic acid biosynthesis-associated methylase
MSKNKLLTDQVKFWNGDFGEEYIDRNLATEDLIKSKVLMWSKILKSIKTNQPKTILEIGANIGLNIRSLQKIHSADYFAIEPNDKARAVLAKDNILPDCNIYKGVATSLPFDNSKFDMVFTSVVLIHIHPDHLLDAYKEIYRVSNRYILTIEYFSKTPESVKYRGHDGFLFKRDFGKFWLENFPDLKVVDYGFFWEPVSGQDDYTWWLFEKTNCE